ncbi:hypothetical protein MNV49_001735 [Pseudohyphozyma bogoriensis]|nr:hypothetical protein MNV49_001735 [Pseudohyphozyma bogoriensis]
MDTGLLSALKSLEVAPPSRTPLSADVASSSSPATPFSSPTASGFLPLPLPTTCPPPDLPTTEYGTPTSPITVLVDSVELLRTCVDDVSQYRVLAVAVEGGADSDGEDIGSLQMHGEFGCTIWVVEVRKLGARVFQEKDDKGQSLKVVFEDDSVRKMFFDCRNATHALCKSYNVTVNGVFDLQLLELAHREASTHHRQNHLRSLAATINAHPRVITGLKKIQQHRPAADSRLSTVSDNEGEQRREDARLENAAADVAVLFPLEEQLETGVPQHTEERILEESRKRVRYAQSVGYDPTSRMLVLAPLGW